MRNFIKSLLSNRFGIVLATLNVCYLLYWFNNSSGFRPLTAFLIFCLDLPALILTALLTGIFHLFFYTVPSEMVVRMNFVLLPFFVAFQWLFIGRLSKALAEKLRSPN